MINVERFVETFLPKQDEKKLIRYAKIAPDYTDGKPQLIFDGETVSTLKRYQCIDHYNPLAGDTVMVIDGVVMGKIVR